MLQSKCVIQVIYNYNLSCNTNCLDLKSWRTSYLNTKLLAIGSPDGTVLNKKRESAMLINIKRLCHTKLNNFYLRLITLCCNSSHIESLRVVSNFTINPYFMNLNHDRDFRLQALNLMNFWNSMLMQYFKWFYYISGR